MAIKLVVFDMAGTTVEDNNNVAEALKSALFQFGYKALIEDINMVMGLPKPVAITSLIRDMIDEIPNEEEVNKIFNLFEKIMIEYYLTSPSVSEKEGASQLFYLLKNNGIKVGIDTGFSRNVADAIITRLGWKANALIDISVTSDEVENGRPYPDMIFKAMADLDISDTLDVAKVGDTISDMKEGSSAGCKFIIGIAGKVNTAEELASEMHTHIITSLGEIPDIILN